MSLLRREKPVMNKQHKDVGDTAGHKNRDAKRDEDRDAKRDEDRDAERDECERHGRGAGGESPLGTLTEGTPHR